MTTASAPRGAFQYYVNGESHTLRLAPIDRGIVSSAQRPRPGASSSDLFDADRVTMFMPSDVALFRTSNRIQPFESQLTRTDKIVRTIRSSPVLDSRFNEVQADKLLAVADNADDILAIATDTLIVEGATKSDIVWAHDKFGTEIIDERSDGKILLRASGANAVKTVFDVARKLKEERSVGAVSPNFVRAFHRPPTTKSPPSAPWAHDILRARDAWKITRGVRDVLVAVLDEGIDTSHPALAKAIFAQQDFIEGKGDDARPTGNDAHGTACAGIIASVHAKCYGLAPNVGLIAARIAMGDGANGWIFDDFATADAIDWARRTGAHVLSCSWGGGPAVDSISQAFERARTLGRNKRGAVVVLAAGNHERPIEFPGNLDNMLVVGASNRFDERKTKSTQDNQPGWGSNHGPTLNIVAPGVQILTTDIAGASGYGPDDFTMFDGTSAAAPHVAAAAALILSIAPSSTEAQVRNMITSTAARLVGQSGRSSEHGHGRLDLAAAVLRAFTPPSGATAVKKNRKKKIELSDKSPVAKKSRQTTKVDPKHQKKP